MEKIKREYPIYARHISVSLYPIGGELSSFFMTVKEKMFPEDWKNRDRAAVTKWLEEHTTVETKRYRGRELNASAGSFVAASKLNRWYIKVRIPRTKGGPFPWLDYMYISKSLVGCTDITYDETKEPPNDHCYTIVDPEKYAKSGYGLFFNRDFKMHELIGVYCGDIKLKRYLADTGYNIDWKNKHYVVDGVGPGWPIYFGWHYANAPENPEGANVLIDDDMYIYPNRDVKKGEEAFFFYGKKRDQIDNLKLPDKKGKKGGKRKRK